MTAGRPDGVWLLGDDSAADTTVRRRIEAELKERGWMLQACESTAEAMSTLCRMDRDRTGRRDWGLLSAPLVVFCEADATNAADEANEPERDTCAETNQFLAAAKEYVPSAVRVVWRANAMHALDPLDHVDPFHRARAASLQASSGANDDASDDLILTSAPPVSSTPPPLRLVGAFDSPDGDVTPASDERGVVEQPEPTKPVARHAVTEPDPIDGIPADHDETGPVDDIAEASAVGTTDDACEPGDAREVDDAEDSEDTDSTEPLVTPEELRMLFGEDSESDLESDSDAPFLTVAAGTDFSRDPDTNRGRQQP